MSTAEPQTESRSNVAHSMDLIADSLAFGVVFTVGLTIVQRGVGFLRSILFCRYMSDAQLGQWSMIFSFLMLLAPLAALGLPGSFSRFAEHYLQQGQIRTFLRRIAVVSFSVTCLVAATIYLFPSQFSQVVFRSSQHAGLINSMVFALIMVAASNFLISLIESLRQVRLVALMRFIQGVGFAILGTLFVVYWGQPVAAATFGFGIACTLCCLPAIWLLWKKQHALADTGEFLESSKMWRRIAPFAVWLWASNLVWNLFEVADRYMLVHWSSCPAAEAHGLVGQYHSARVVPMLLVGVAVVLEGVLTPFMSALWEQQKNKEAGSQLSFALKLLSFGFTFGSIAILVLSPLLFDAILSGRYNDGLTVLPTTLLYSTWFSMFLFGQIYLWVAERGGWVFGITTAGLLLNLALNAALIPHWGLWGAVVATTVATVFCLMLTLAINRLAENPIGISVCCCCAVPLIILLPLYLALFVFTVLIIVASTTGLFFDKTEKNQIIAKFADAASKLYG